MRKFICCFLLLFCTTNVVLSQEDSVAVSTQALSSEVVKPRKNILQRLRNFVESFSDVDPNYITCGIRLDKSSFFRQNLLISLVLTLDGDGFFWVIRLI